MALYSYLMFIYRSSEKYRALCKLCLDIWKVLLIKLSIIENRIKFG